MAPRNPSELQRQEDMVEELYRLRKLLRNPNRSKYAKEQILQSIRLLERHLDVEHVPYNKG